MNTFVVTRNVYGLEIACRCLFGAPWLSQGEAWRALDYVLTWDTQEGAQLFADMNGGTVRPLSEVFDHTVILPPHGPLQHSPDEAGPLESGTDSQTQE